MLKEEQRCGIDARLPTRNRTHPDFCFRSDFISFSFCHKITEAGKFNNKVLDLCWVDNDDCRSLLTMLLSTFYCCFYLFRYRPWHPPATATTTAAALTLETAILRSMSRSRIPPPWIHHFVPLAAAQEGHQALTPLLLLLLLEVLLAMATLLARKSTISLTMAVIMLTTVSNGDFLPGLFAAVVTCGPIG